MVGVPGLEPGLTEPESGGLPITPYPRTWHNVHTLYVMTGPQARQRPCLMARSDPTIGTSTNEQHSIRATLLHMANLTLVIDDEVLRASRIRALREDTSVNAQVRDFLTAYAADEQSAVREAMEHMIQLSMTMEPTGGLDDRDWTRDDLYER